MDKQNVEEDSSRQDTIIVGIIVVLFLGITGFPSLIFTVLFITFFKLITSKFEKVDKMYFCILAAACTLLINLKISFYSNFLLKVVGLVKDITLDAMHRGHNFKTIYLAYLKNISWTWQILLGLILASVLFYFLNKNSTKKKDEAEDPKIKKQLKKIEDIHLPDSSVMGIDYNTVEVVDIEDKAKGILIAGTTGSGKTVTGANLIDNAMYKDYPCVIIDGKGDLGDDGLLHYVQGFSKKYNRKLYVINLVEPKMSNYYNPFQNASATEAKDMLIGMNDWTEPYYKLNSERYFQQLVKILNKKEIPLNLNVITEYYPKKFKSLIDEMNNNNELGINEYMKLSDIIETTGGSANSAMARFATTAESDCGIIFSKADGIDVYNALKENANILFILDSLGKPEMSRQIGRLVILDIKKAVSKLFGSSKRKLFFFDEFNVYASDVAIDVLNKSRSAGCTCVAAVQSLSDLDKAGGPALRNQVIDNCNNYFVMRQNSPDSSNTWEQVLGKKKVIKYTYGMEESAGFLGKGKKSTGKGSMYKVDESNYPSTKIQNLAPGDSIYLLKDQDRIGKARVRYLKPYIPHPILDTKIEVENNIDNNKEKFDDIKKILSKEKV